jgi:hypothetical protein
MVRITKMVLSVLHLAPNQGRPTGLPRGQKHAAGSRQFWAKVGFARAGFTADDDDLLRFYRRHDFLAAGRDRCAAFTPLYITERQVAGSPVEIDKGVPIYWVSQTSTR